MDLKLITTGTIVVLLSLVSISGFVITMTFGTGLTGIVNSTFVSGNRGWISTIPDLCLFGVGPTTNNVTLINTYLLNEYPIGSKVYYNDYCKNLITSTQKHKYIMIGVYLIVSSVLAIIMIIAYIYISRKQEITNTYIPLKEFSAPPLSSGLPPPYSL